MDRTPSPRSARLAGALLLALVGLSACSEDAKEQATPDATSPGPADAAPSDAAASDPATSIRGVRYCEILLIYAEAGGIDAQVWGTQGLNLCPEEQWAPLDAGTLRAETGATLVVLNGPRYWLIDTIRAERPAGDPRRFGALEMQQLATLELSPGMTQRAPYTETTVNRSSRFTYRAGSEIYELIAPDGTTYVMQSYAQIVDAGLGETDLPNLGARLELPPGWSYRARTLEADLIVDTPDGATVLQDELQNSYSRHGS